MNSGPTQNGYSLKEMGMFLMFPAIKVLGVPPTQPLAKIAAEQQKSTSRSKVTKNIVQTAKDIYATHGIKGFFVGTTAGMVREGMKTSYKGPLQVFANDFSSSAIPPDISGSYIFRGLVAGTIVGVLDPTIAGPVERYKTLRLAQDGNIKFFGFLKQIYSQQNHNSLPRKIAGFTSELYRGLPVTVAKQTLMNVAFFSVKPWADFIAKPYKQDYPLMSVAFTSLAPAIGAAAVGAPLDVVKTLTQHQTGATKGIIPLLRLVVQNTGFRGLFAGVGARFGLITFGYSLNGLFLNLFEQNRQHPTAPPSTQATHHSPNEVEDLTERLGSLSIDTKVDDLTKQLDALSIKEPQASTQAAPNTYLVKKSNPTSHEKDLTTQTSSLDNKSSKPK